MPAFSSTGSRAAGLLAAAGFLAGCIGNSGSVTVDTLCSLEPIAITLAVRAHLRAPLDPAAVAPDGYEAFIRQLAAHNAKLRANCGR